MVVSVFSSWWLPTEKKVNDGIVEISVPRDRLSPIAFEDKISNWVLEVEQGKKETHIISNEIELAAVRNLIGIISLQYFHKQKLEQPEFMFNKLRFTVAEALSNHSQVFQKRFSIHVSKSEKKSSGLGSLWTHYLLFVLWFDSFAIKELLVFQIEPFFMYTVCAMTFD